MRKVVWLLAPILLAGLLWAEGRKAWHPMVDSAAQLQEVVCRPAGGIQHLAVLRLERRSHRSRHRLLHGRPTTRRASAASSFTRAPASSRSIFPTAGSSLSATPSTRPPSSAWRSGSTTRTPTPADSPAATCPPRCPNPTTRAQGLHAAPRDGAGARRRPQVQGRPAEGRATVSATSPSTSSRRDRQARRLTTRSNWPSTASTPGTAASPTWISSSPASREKFIDIDHARLREDARQRPRPARSRHLHRRAQHRAAARQSTRCAGRPTCSRSSQKRWGYDLRPHLPSLFEETGDWRKVRHNYYALLLDLFIDRWAKPWSEYADHQRHLLDRPLLGARLAQPQRRARQHGHVRLAPRARHRHAVQPVRRRRERAVRQRARRQGTRQRRQPDGPPPHAERNLRRRGLGTALRGHEAAGRMAVRAGRQPHEPAPLVRNPGGRAQARLSAVVQLSHALVAALSHAGRLLRAPLAGALERRADQPHPGDRADHLGLAVPVLLRTQCAHDGRSATRSRISSTAWNPRRSNTTWAPRTS